MVEIKTVNKGAELTSVKIDGEEKIHDGKSFWNRHSPILFPIVGKLKDGKTRINGNIYEMGQHGFARDMEFEKIKENSYVLRANEETLKKYPFKFELYVSYEVIKNKIITKYRIINKDENQMAFGLGAHPAFVCDYSNGMYKLEFEYEEENIQIYQLENGLIKENPEQANNFIDKNIIRLNKGTFKNDAIIMKNINSNKIFLKKDENEILELDFKGFPYIAIWSKPNAPFICIEPWYNTADKVNSNGIFEEKENLIKLLPNQEFNCEYCVEFFK